MANEESVEKSEGMSKITKIFIALSIGITLLFLAIGATFCYRSYVRFFETLCSLFESIALYFCKLFNIQNTIHLGMLDTSPTLEQEIASLPTSSPIFALKFKVYFRLLIDGAHYGQFFACVGEFLKGFLYFVLIALPFVVLFIVLMKLLYSRENKGKHNPHRPTAALLLSRSLHNCKHNQSNLLNVNI